MLGLMRAPLTQLLRTSHKHPIIPYECRYSVSHLMDRMTNRLVSSVRGASGSRPWGPFEQDLLGFEIHLEKMAIVKMGKPWRNGEDADD